MKSFKPVIEKNIPMPQDIAKKGKNKSIRVVWPFNDMEIGDSVAIPETVTYTQAYKALWKSYHDGRLDRARKFEFRTVEGRLRVWRVE